MTITTNMNKSKKLKFQLLSEEEITFATATAHLAMAKQVQAYQEKYPPCIFERAETNQGHNLKESSMRFKQISRRVDQIRTELNHLRKISKTSRDSLFIPPLVLETMNKRWNEYCCSSRRALFNLRREITQLNTLISLRNPNTDKFMRKMSLSVRSILMLLQGLTKYSDKIQPGGDGRALYFEIAETAKNVLKLSASIGVIASNSKPQEQTDTSITESSLENPSRSLVLESSDLNSEVLNVISPENVRKNLANLVLTNGKKKGKTRSVKGTNQYKAAPKSYLSQERPFEELPGGRRIQLVQDSLSPILKQQAILDAQSKSVHFRQKDANSMGKRPYGNAEKMADALFEQMLPRIKDSVKMYQNISVKDDFITQMNDLLKRLTVLEQKRKKHAQYLSDISHSHHTPEKKTNRIEDVIGAANQSLFEASRLGLTSLPVEPTDVQPPETLAAVKQQKEEFWVSLVKNNYLPNENSQYDSGSHELKTRGLHSKDEVKQNYAEEQVHIAAEDQTRNASGPPKQLEDASESRDSHQNTPSEHRDHLENAKMSGNNRSISPASVEEDNNTQPDSQNRKYPIVEVHRNTEESEDIPEQVDGSFSYESTSANSEVLESSSQFFDSKIESS